MISSSQGVVRAAGQYRAAGRCRNLRPSTRPVVSVFITARRSIVTAALSARRVGCVGRGEQLCGVRAFGLHPGDQCECRQYGKPLQGCLVHAGRAP